MLFYVNYFLANFLFTAVKSKNQKTTSIKRTAVAAKVLNKDNQHLIFSFSYFQCSLQQKIKIDKSLFKRFLNNGFDGISTNPNYKMLALLIVLLINLSLFFVIGNMGKAFLRNAGIMG